MDRGIRNWMFASGAIVLIECGAFVGGHWHFWLGEWVLYGMAAALVIIMAIRWLWHRYFR
jgi:hypothetical protein